MRNFIDEFVHNEVFKNNNLDVFLFAIEIRFYVRYNLIHM